MEFEIKPPGRASLGVKELAGYYELFYFFTWRDIKVKYKQTALGFLWAVIQPALMVLIFTVFFGRVLKVPSDSLPYPVFVFAGMLLWNVFSSGLSNAANSMVSNANIIKKIYFPRLIIPLSAVLSALFDFLMALMVFIVLILIYGLKINVLYFSGALLLSIFMVAFGTVGPGCLLAALNVKYRDFRYVIPFLLQALMFVTPVIYPVSLFQNELYRYLLAMNPITGAILLFRSSLMNTPPDVTLVSISLCSSILFFFAGIYYFRRTESYFADLA